MDTQSIIHALSAYDRLPKTALKAAGEKRAEIAPILIEEIDAYADPKRRDPDKGDLIFMGVHLLAFWREEAAYRPLARLLRMPSAEIDALLDDAITVTLHRVMAGIFDGDLAPLADITRDADVNMFVRSAMLEVLPLLVRDGRLSIEKAGAFLREVHAILPREPDAHGEPSAVWIGWAEAVRMLGLESLRPLLPELEEFNILGNFYQPREEFEAEIAENAKAQRPDWYDEARYAPYGDPVEELASWHGFSEAGIRERQRQEEKQARREAIMAGEIQMPQTNPTRDVGRNDPCPCGSGKKFKKCCLH